jgi:hypothetical protein
MVAVLSSHARKEVDDRRIITSGSGLCAELGSLQTHLKDGEFESSEDLANMGFIYWGCDRVLDHT